MGSMMVFPSMMVLSVHLRSVDKSLTEWKEVNNLIGPRVHRLKLFVNDVTKMSEPIASHQLVLREGFHKTGHTSTCTRTKVYRSCLARDGRKLRDMAMMCGKKLW